MQDEYESRKPKKIVAWFLICPLVWLILLAGWMFLLSCPFFGCQVPPSGAVLVCCALISDIMLRSISWGKLRTFSLITHFRLGESYRGRAYFLTDGYKMLATNSARCLFSLADPKEEFWHGKRDCWQASKTAHRVSERIYLSILASAIVGTLVWGYGHLV